jgi:hypothetical protein
MWFSYPWGTNPEALPHINAKEEVMAEEVVVVKKPGGIGDPPHEAVRLHRDLIKLMKFIREKYQEKIDQAFDRVSRQIGFVVATTMPVTLEMAQGGKVMRLAVGAKHLENTLFDKEIIGTLKGITEGPTPEPSQPGVYNLYVIWFEALKFKLKTDWVEPAHVLAGRLRELFPAAAAAYRPEVQEPAHWFDPGSLISLEERVLIDVIDEVYPELRLVERLDLYRRGVERFGPLPDPWISGLGAILKPDPTPWKAQLVREINEVLRRYGLNEAIPQPLH